MVRRACISGSLDGVESVVVKRILDSVWVTGAGG
jgi:hypothetical protein